MNQREAMQALLNGKKLTSNYEPTHIYFFLNEDGHLIDNEGDAYTLGNDESYYEFNPNDTEDDFQQKETSLKEEMEKLGFMFGQLQTRFSELEKKYFDVSLVPLRISQLEQNLHLHHHTVNGLDANFKMLESKVSALNSMVSALVKEKSA